MVLQEVIGTYAIFMITLIVKLLEGGRHNTGSFMRTKGVAQHPETARKRNSEKYHS